ncbi:hypothetical protein CEUSTIGMA_g8425.t1 [Chlamydomonas eustigma]|uniref:RRM domain-containing protein n=1 Tax=Chlamydomonas eustigma TaxID=1157962 RepID=A0A250XDY7_9CHLO|nr:hypothetical protein CEUSTIGMA_g8425.t1 [Chlamydomonas eustigma]|eukprot:GAX80990.1 hypothetical protein CEUSTIGMA_g8425.t1 [Chlamydomonas eustigma]
MADTTGHSNDNLVPHSNVYVRGLSQRVDEEVLSDVFRKFGNIISLRLFKTGQVRSQGTSLPNSQLTAVRPQQFSKKPTFAFIKYGAFEEAQASIAALNGSTLLESIIEVRLADNDTDPSSGPSHVEKIPPPSDNIYCKNLPLGWAENDLRALFQPFGHVSMIRILLPAENMGQGGAALVRMASLEEARTAIQRLQGHQLIGAQQPIVIRFADSADIKAKKQNKASGGNTEITALGRTSTSTNYYSSSTMMNSSAVTSSPTPALPTNDSPPHQYHTPPNKRNPYGSLAAASTAVAVTTSTSSSPDADAFNYRSIMQHQPSMMTQSSNTTTGWPFPLPPSNAYGPSVFGGPSTSGYFPPGMAFASPPEYSNFQGYLGYNTPLFPPHQRPVPPFNGGRSMSLPSLTYPRRPALSSQDFLGSSSGGHYGRPVSSSNSSMAAATASTSAASSALPPAVIAVVTSLYVKNLPPDADRLFLYEKFAPFGAILSVKILEDEEGVSKGVGFVNFADADCASKAASTLHNLLVGDRHLRVAFQTHKKS